MAGVVFVKSGSGRSPGVDHIAHFLETELLGHVPEDGAVADAQDIGQPVVVAHRNSDAGRAYDALGERIDGFVEPLRSRHTAATEAPPRTGRVMTAQDGDAATLEAADPDGTGFDFVTEDGEAEQPSPADHGGRAGAEGEAARETGSTEDRADAADEVRTHDGRRIYVARDERLRGTDGVFHPVYADADRGECCGWACSCGNVGLETDLMERLDCSDCGNTSRATRWDAPSL